MIRQIASTFTSALAIAALASPMLSAAVPAKRFGVVSINELYAEQRTQKALRELEASAALVAREADQWKTVAAGNFAPETHLERLDVMKQSVNRLGREIAALEAEHDALPPWEQQAIDRVLPLVQAAAANTGHAIEAFNASRGHEWASPGWIYASRVEQDSHQAAKTLKDYLKYEKLRDREAKLELQIFGD